MFQGETLSLMWDLLLLICLVSWWLGSGHKEARACICGRVGRESGPCVHVWGSWGAAGSPCIWWGVYCAPRELWGLAFWWCSRHICSAFLSVYLVKSGDSVTSHFIKSFKATSKLSYRSNSNKFRSFQATPLRSLSNLPNKKNVSDLNKWFSRKLISKFCPINYSWGRQIFGVRVIDRLKMFINKLKRFFIKLLIYALKIKWFLKLE